MAIRPADLAIILVYLLGITLLGLRLRGRDRSVRGYFLGNEDLPWWALSLSIVAAETSTLTLISVPGLAYDTDFSFLQLALGYFMGRLVISAVLLPQFFKRGQAELLTVYQWIARRFGTRLQSVTAGIFLVTRAAAEGVRVYAISMVVSTALGLSGSFADDLIAIGIIVLLTLIYTYHGGLNAVIWTDTVQTGLYFTGALVGLGMLIHSFPEGMHTFIATGVAERKFAVFQFGLDFRQTYGFWAGLIGGTFLTTASHGTDQLLAQRLLAARSEKKARWALISSGFFIFFQFAFFLTIGAALFVYYRLHPPALPFGRSDRVFPDFVVHHLPVGLTGLLLASILAAAMSNLSAALNSLASTSVLDFYVRARPASTEAQRLALSRAATLGWALALLSLALVSRQGGRLVETALAIASVAYGPLLGVFAAGALSARVREKAALVGMLAGFAANLSAWLLHRPPIAFLWFVAYGSLTTLLVALGMECLISRFSGRLRSSP